MLRTSTDVTKKKNGTINDGGMNDEAIILFSIGSGTIQ